MVQNDVKPERGNAERLLHDLNNALTVVLSTAAMLHADVPATSPFAVDVSDLHANARVAAALVEALAHELRERRQ